MLDGFFNRSSSESGLGIAGDVCEILPFVGVFRIKWKVEIVANPLKHSVGVFGEVFVSVKPVFAGELGESFAAEQISFKRELRLHNREFAERQELIDRVPNSHSDPSVIDAFEFFAERKSKLGRSEWDADVVKV